MSIIQHLLILNDKTNTTDISDHCLVPLLCIVPSARHMLHPPFLHLWVLIHVMKIYCAIAYSLINCLFLSATNCSNGSQTSTQGLSDCTHFCIGPVLGEFGPEYWFEDGCICLYFPLTCICQLQQSFFNGELIKLSWSLQ